MLNHHFVKGYSEQLLSGILFLFAVRGHILLIHHLGERIGGEYHEKMYPETCSGGDGDGHSDVE